MRTKDELFALEEVTILLQYLYMSKDHTIKFNNGIVDLEVRMTEDFNFQVLNHNFSDLGWVGFTGSMVLPTVLGIIDILKETPSRQPDLFKTQWEEIVKISQANLALNFKH